MRTDKAIIHDGKEYVTLREFAFRVDASYSLINNYVRDGYLTAVDIQKTGIKYLEWSTQLVAFRITRLKKNATGGSGRKKKATNPIMRVTNISSPSVSTPDLQIQEATIPEITVDSSVVDLSKFNPYEHKDCWIIGSDGEPTKDPDGKPRIDYELMKTKVMAQTYQVKLDKETRSVIPKDELISTVQGVCTVFKSSVDNIAQKYASPLIAICESITGHEFTSEEHTKVMNILRNVPKEIFPSIQKELEKMIENAETEV